MGTKERKKREREHRRDQILDAAIALIEEHGFEKTTMDEIADRAELSKGTLYLYYNDKATLYQAIKKRALKYLHEEFHHIIQEDSEGALLVKKMMLTFLNLINENVTFTKAMMLYERTNNQDSPKDNSVIKACASLENELLMLIIRAIQIGKQDGSIQSSVESKVLALQIAFQIRGMLQFRITDSDSKGFKIMAENDITMEKLMEQFLQIQFNKIEL